MSYYTYANTFYIVLLLLEKKNVVLFYGYSFLPDYGESEKVIVWQSIYVYTFHFSASVLKQFYWMRLQYISTTEAGDITLNKF